MKERQNTPKLTTIELKGCVEGMQRLVEMIERGQRNDATRSEKADAVQAAHTLLRSAPLTVKLIRKLEGYAEEVANTATGRRDDIMTNLFGPDET